MAGILRQRGPKRPGQVVSLNCINVDDRPEFTGVAPAADLQPERIEQLIVACAYLPTVRVGRGKNQIDLR